MKHTNICIIGVPGKKEKVKWVDNVFDEIMAEYFSNLKKETDIQVQETQRVPNKINPNRLIPRGIIIKMSKAKEKEL